MADDSNVNEHAASLEEAKQQLIAKAKKDGKIDQRDITAALPDTPDNVDILDGLYTELADNNIKITAGNEPAGAAFTDGWAEEETEEEDALTQKDEKEKQDKKDEWWTEPEPDPFA